MMLTTMPFGQTWADVVPSASVLVMRDAMTTATVWRICWTLLMTKVHAYHVGGLRTFARIFSKSRAETSMSAIEKS